jgi:hypothetical protein
MKRHKKVRWKRSRPPTHDRAFKPSEKRRWKALFSISQGWSIIAGISVLMTILGSIYAFSPKITVTPMSPSYPADPLTTRFVIANDSYLPVYAVTLICDANKIHGAKMTDPSVTKDGQGLNIGGFKVMNARPISEIDPGEKTTVDCIATPADQPPDWARVDIVVQYRPALLPWYQERRFRFRTEKKHDGQFVWIPQSLAE